MSTQGLPKLTRHSLANALYLLTGEAVVVRYKRTKRGVPAYYYFEYSGKRYASASLAALWEVLQGSLFDEAIEEQVTVTDLCAKLDPNRSELSEQEKRGQNERANIDLASNRI